MEQVKKNGFVVTNPIEKRESAAVDKDFNLEKCIKFEMQAVRGNILMTADEKNAKIVHLKRIVPHCKDWGGLDSIMVDKVKRNIRI